MSRREEQHVQRLSEAAYYSFGKGLLKDDVISVCWVAYLENKQKLIGFHSEDYWMEAAKYMEKYIAVMRRDRNRRCSVQSKLSMNQTCNDSGEEIGSILFHIYGDFTKSVALWDYARRLGEKKWKIIKCIVYGDDDREIMRRVNMDEECYWEIKKGLQEDMNRYINSM